MNKFEEIEKRKKQGTPIASSAKELGVSVSNYYYWKAKQKKKSSPVRRAVKKLRMETIEVSQDTGKLFMFVGSVEQFKNLLGKI